MPRLQAELSGRLDRAFEDALARGHFSGAGMIVSVRDGFTLSKTWGCERRGGDAIEAATRFDLASLTKPLVTVPLVMSGVGRGIIGLDDPLPRFFGDAVPPEKRGITIRHILSHCSGLAPYRQFFFDLVDMAPEDRREAVVSMVLNDPPDAAPGSAAAYSDLGYIILGAILERVFGDRLDRLAREVLFSPLGLDELHFCPLKTEGGPEVLPVRVPDFPEDGVRYAAAEFCSWRKRLLVGEVSDENAWSLGGVAGHAGLFGTARGVFKMISFMRDIYRGELEHPLFSQDLARLFWTRAGAPAGSTWALGFDTPRLVESSAGRYFSQKSVGHLGFTGTSFWLDLERDVLVVLLANRVHPSRENEAFKKFRPIVHDIVMEALEYAL
ncbi:MAG: serine hydrolase domain-containing protein [Syntrophobacteraceae bacterium]